MEITRKAFLERSAKTGFTLAVTTSALSVADCTGDKFLRDVRLTTLDQVKEELRRLEKAGSVKNDGPWTVFKVMQHCGQSIEYSMIGFPEYKSWLFQNTLGKIGKAKFIGQGYMSHNLGDPIPGAPVIQDTGNDKDAIRSLILAVEKFQRFTDSVRPHFAYGELNKSEADQLQAMHVANHLAVMDY